MFSLAWTISAVRSNVMFVLRALSAFQLILACAADTCKYPGGECYELRLQKCDGASPYTLHGLWPQWSSNCQGPDFNMSAISSIQDQMKTKWGSCPEFGQTNEKFWSHEWSKHGTCAGLASELDFFKTALEQYDAHVGHCGSGVTCSVCLSKDLSQVLQCSDSSELLV